MSKVTFDTNIANQESLTSLAESKGYEVSFVSVTDRELEGTDIQKTSKSRIVESAVFGESKFNNAVWASESQEEIFENVLSVISNNSFPVQGARNNLSEGQRHQLRDAMIFSDHVREKGAIFVTNDSKGFISNGRREKLEALGRTRILTSIEFKNELAQ